MFKLMMFFVILGIGIFLGYCIYKILINETKKVILNEEDSTSIEELIRKLKIKIQLYEQELIDGKENAEAKLADYKERLKNAESLITKTKNL